MMTRKDSGLRDSDWLKSDSASDQTHLSQPWDPSATVPRWGWNRRRRPGTRRERASGHDKR